MSICYIVMVGRTLHIALVLMHMNLCALATGCIYLDFSENNFWGLEGKGLKDGV